MKEFGRRQFLQAGLVGVGAWLFRGEIGKETRALPIVRVATDQPYVCIGIDDGYNSAAVEEFLRIAEKYKTRFTVFPVGTVLLNNPSLWQEVKAAGHEIGNHSHSHISVRGRSKEEIRQDFSQFEEVDYPQVFSEVFPTPGTARVPYALGAVNWNVQEVLYELGDLQVHWLWDSYSWTKNGVNTRSNRQYALANIGAMRRGNIGVMHFNQLDMAILPAFLELMAGRGLTNVTFGELYNSRRI